jgi:hypothetical protein
MQCAASERDKHRNLNLNQHKQSYCAIRDRRSGGACALIGSAADLTLHETKHEYRHVHGNKQNMEEHQSLQLAPVSDCPDEGHIAVALLKYQTHCLCKSCLSEIIMTALRVGHLYRNPPCGDVDPEQWRWSMAVCEPFTEIEAALLDTNDGQFIKLAYPALASLIEKELRARYEEDFESSHEVQERPRGTFCAAASRN